MAQPPQSTPDIHIPDGLMEVVFILAGTYEKKEVNNEKEAKKVNGSCVIGLQTESHFVKGRGIMHMVGIKFTPLGFARFFGHRVFASKNEQVELADFGASWLCELQGRMVETKGISAISQLISSALQRQLARSGEVANSLEVSANCISSIFARKGCLTVEDLSATHHKSVRQIQRYFREHFDASPKEFINIIRFKNLYQDSIIRQHLPHQFLDYGYFDQAHFIHDFRRRTGVSPTQAVQSDFLEKNKIAAINLGK
jgi:AraC-like DNA-binding protein